MRRMQTKCLELCAIHLRRCENCKKINKFFKNSYCRQQPVTRNQHNPVPEIYLRYCTTLRQRTLKRRALKTEESYTNFQQITEDEWMNKVFPILREINKPVWEAQFEEDLILSCSRIFQIKQPEVAMMEYSLGFPDNQSKILRNLLPYSH